jgi:hypothetical protein
MKSTDNFKKVIFSHLEKVANNDKLFAETFKNPSKNIDDCVTYILNEVQKSGCNGFDDDEIFGMAIHYYDEQNIEVGKSLSTKVIVNHHVEITEEEKAEIKKKALDEILTEEKRRLTQKKAPVPTKKNDTEEFLQGSLF